MDWLIPVLWLENTCMIPQERQWVACFLNCSTASGIMKMEWVACMYILHGGWIIRNLISHVDTILNIGEAWVCLHMDLAGAWKTLMVSTWSKANKKKREVMANPLKKIIDFFMAQEWAWQEEGKLLQGRIIIAR